MNIIYIDPELQASKNIDYPDNLVFACSYEMQLAAYEIYVAAFFRRSDNTNTDEVWLIVGNFEPLLIFYADRLSPDNLLKEKIISSGCALIIEKQGDEKESCRLMVEKLMRSQGQAWPKHFISGGLIEKELYDAIRKQINTDYDNNKKLKAKSHI